MKQINIITILAIIIFAVSATSAFAQDETENWVTFSKSPDLSNEASNHSINKFGCSDSIYAKANFRPMVDTENGFTVTILVDEEVVVQEKMNGGSAASVTETIHVELVPDDKSFVRFPTATIIYAETILTKLSSGKHTIQIAINPGTDYDTLAVGEFEFDNRSGCDTRFARAKRKLNGDIADLQRKQTDGRKQPVEQVEERQTQTQSRRETQQQEQQNTVPSQREEPRPEPAKPVENPEVEIYNSCGDTRYLQIEFPSGSTENLNFHGTREYPRYPLGTKIYVVTDGNKELIDTVVANPSNTSYGRQVITLCK